MPDLWLIFIYLVVLLSVCLFGFIAGILTYKLRIRFAMRIMLPLAERELEDLNESFKKGRLRAVRQDLRMNDWISVRLRPMYKNEVKMALHRRWQLKEAIRRVLNA